MEGRCSQGWPSFWLAVVSGTASSVINGLVLPTVATAFFNGGVDPCVGEGHASDACGLPRRELGESWKPFQTAISDETYGIGLQNQLRFL